MRKYGLTKRIRYRSMPEQALHKAIRSGGGSQSALARRSGLKREKINYLLNRTNKISLEDAIIIEEATDGVVSCLELATELDSRVRRRLEGVFMPSQSTKTISERVQSALAIENSLGGRQGHRTDLPLRKKIYEVAGRTDSEAAKRVGFKNHMTYRQAKRVVLQGVPELIRAMDAEKIAISTASLITSYTPDEQRKIVLLDKKSIITAAKEVKKCRKIN